MNKKQKSICLRLGLALPLLAGALIFSALLAPIPFYIEIFLYLPAYLLVGADVLWRAFGNAVRGRVLDEHFLMTVATVGAFAIGEYAEAVFVMLFFRVGELFEGLATRRARGALRSLADLVPDTAHRVGEDGAVCDIDASDVSVGDTVQVLAGERIPVDGVVAAGRAVIDLSAMTGESLPVDVTVGEALPAGALCLDGVLTLTATRVAEESTAARILEMVENATDRKAKVEGFITRFARVYTPIVCALSLAVALLLPLFGVKWTQSVYTALSFLVISCPCALVISVPLSFFCGIGGGARCGILFKGSRELERMAHVRAAAFDKTGTLTHGTFTPTAILPISPITERELLFTAAAMETASTHPIARSVVRAYEARADATPLPAPRDIRETAGGGVCGFLGEDEVLVGNRRFLSAAKISVPPLSVPAGQSEILVAKNGAYLGAILISDTLREDAAPALAALRALGVSPLLLLSGDREAVARAVAAPLGLDGVWGDLRPEDKAEVLREEKEKSGRRFLFLGDGINDAPTLALADCGVAMGALGSDAAAFSADVVLLSDGLSDLPTALRIARRTRRIVYENIVFALSVKTLVMLLSTLSLVGMGAAVFADVGVSVIAIINAIRAGYIKK